MRRKAVSAMMAFVTSGGRVASVVLIALGATALTRMPRGPSSLAIALVHRFIPALQAPYIAASLGGRVALTEEIFTIALPDVRCGKAAASNGYGAKR